jgi:hypothetical protein
MIEEIAAQVKGRRAAAALRGEPRLGRVHLRARRGGGSRRCVVVADAQELLAADPPAREELLTQLPSGPHCMGGGWSTLVLAESGGHQAGQRVPA